MSRPFGFAEEDRLLTGRVKDAVSYVCRHQRPKFIGFLDLHEKEVCISALKNEKHAGFFFWGGYGQAERVYLGVFPAKMENDAGLFPLCAVQAVWKYDKLSHRDFLGSMISSGVERSSIGDIIVNEESCIIILERSVSEFVILNLGRVKGAAVKCSYYDGRVERHDEFKEIKTTIASQRLDCVVCALTGVSRAEAVEMIESGNVFVDFMAALNTTQKVNVQSTVSIRGYGRFIIDMAGPLTRKGRLTFLAKKYL